MPLTPEHRAKLSAARMGHSVSEETRAKIAAKLTGRKNGPHSEEWNAKIRDAQKGIPRGPLTEEHRAKLSEVRKGRKRAPFSQEWRDRIGEASRGRKSPAGGATSPRDHAHRKNGGYPSPSSR